MDVVPPFNPTPVDDIPKVAGQIRQTFLSHKTRPIEYRIAQLRKLYWGFEDNGKAVIEACKRDLGKPTFETYAAELDWVKNDIVFVCKNLEKWAKEESAPDIPWTNKLTRPRIRKDPLGAVLVLGAYNFPFQLSVGPFIGAIAAGCTAVLKPSENAPASAAVIEKIFRESLDPSAYAVVQGAIPEATALLEQKWDKIFYTGGATVGTIVAKKAAETLTPVALELGGRNPAIITKRADVRLAARRLLWAKLINAGQVCISQNYTLVDKEMLPSYIEELRKALNEFYPRGAKASSDYSRIVNERQFRRLKKMLDETNGKILIGGTMDEADRFIEPTIIQVNDMNDSLLAEESFGPFLPLLAVDDLDEAIRIANEIEETPLGIYPFGTRAETDKILDQTRSGGASVNDGFFHGTLPTLEFGGVGTSGQGSYRGRASFDCFVHRRAVTTTPSWMENALKIRYPPYAGKLEKFERMTQLKPDFDRNGRKVLGLLGWLKILVGLGGSNATSAIKRYILVLLLSVGAKVYMSRQNKL